MVTFVTWNVNSIKSRLSHITSYLEETRPDVVLLQEIKCQTDAFPYEAIEELGYNVAAHGQKSYNGVAILSHFPIEDVSTSFPENPDPEQARYIEAVISCGKEPVRVASVYVPNGQEVGADKFAYKLAFLDALYAHLQSLLTYEEMMVIGGDYNVGPEGIDVYDEHLLAGSICFHKEERTRFRALTYLGYTDAFRAKYPDTQAFSWWDYRQSAFEKNHGLRIDHLLLSPQATDRLTDSGMMRELRKREKASDHVPVWCELTE